MTIPSDWKTLISSLADSSRPAAFVPIGYSQADAGIIVYGVGRVQEAKHKEVIDRLIAIIRQS